MNFIDAIMTTDAVCISMNAFLLSVFALSLFTIGTNTHLTSAANNIINVIKAPEKPRLYDMKYIITDESIVFAHRKKKPQAIRILNGLSFITSRYSLSMFLMLFYRGRN